MSIIEDFFMWLKNHDKHVLESYMKKDRKSLNESLILLQEERRKMKNMLHRLEAIIEHHELNSNEHTEVKNQEPGFIGIVDEYLPSIEKKLKKIWSKLEEERSTQDQEFIAKEIPILKSENKRIENRLRKLDEIIAKTIILLAELNEDLCRELSGGHSLAAVGETLKKEFGSFVKKDRSAGRKTIRNFMEKHYNLDMSTSRSLFDLLEEVDFLSYTIDFRKTEKYNFYAPIELEGNDLSPYSGLAVDLIGKWIIKA